MNRRGFLYAGAATAAAMSARSYGRILGANDRVGIGVIGLGRRGTIVGGAFLEDKRARIVAVCDIYDANQGPAAEVSATENLEKAHTRNFIDAIVSAQPANAPLNAGLQASLPVQMALRSYWSHKTVSQAQLGQQEKL
jgi:hypothetical protein